MLVEFYEGIDCPPGAPRPDQYIGKVFEILGVEPVETTSRLFGAWEWHIEKEVASHEEVDSLIDSIAEYNTDIYNHYNIRGTECKATYTSHILEIGYNNEEDAESDFDSLIETMYKYIHYSHTLGNSKSMEKYVEKGLRQGTNEELLYGEVGDIDSTTIITIPFCFGARSRNTALEKFRQFTSSLDNNSKVAYIKFHTVNF